MIVANLSRARACAVKFKRKVNSCIQHQNQTLHYTRHITPKHVTSWRCHLRVIAPRQHSYLVNVEAVANRLFATLCKFWPVQDLNSRPPVHEARTLTVRPSSLSVFKTKIKIQSHEQQQGTCTTNLCRALAGNSCLKSTKQGD